MVSLEQAQSSNARIASSLPEGLVAVFLGGTGAVGQATLKQFIKYTVRPRIYFLGRSQTSGDRITAELKTLNPGGDYCFIRADVSLLSTVDEVCCEIKRREHHINLLFMTTATLLTGKGKIVPGAADAILPGSQANTHDRHSRRSLLPASCYLLFSDTFHRQPPSAIATGPGPSARRHRIHSYQRRSCLG